MSITYTFATGSRPWSGASGSRRSSWLQSGGGRPQQPTGVHYARHCDSALVVGSSSPTAAGGGEPRPLPLCVNAEGGGASFWSAKASQECRSVLRRSSSHCSRAVSWDVLRGVRGGHRDGPGAQGAGALERVAGSGQVGAPDVAPVDGADHQHHVRQVGAGGQRARHTGYCDNRPTGFCDNWRRREGTRALARRARMGGGHRSARARQARTGAPDRTRTCNLGIRRPLLYPLSYGGVAPQGAPGQA